MFFQVGAPESRRWLRHLHIIALFGAMEVGFVVWWWCDVAPARILVWCAIVCAGETGITAVMQLFAARPRPHSELARWAALKTAASACNGMAWSLGPILLEVAGQPVSLLAPVWGILHYTGAAVWDGAYYAPSIFAMLVGVTMPAALWLFFHGGEVGVVTSVCLVISLPFWMWLGWLSSRKVGESIEARLEIAELLRIQTEQTRQIREAHQERNRFFSAASHDLRQPLHAMGFYNSLLPRARDDGERNEILARLSECAASLDRQFNAIIGVAQTDAAVENAEPESSPLDDVFARAIATVRPDAAAKGLRLRSVATRLNADVPPELLERVLTNLLSNAVKYTPSGGVLLGARRRGEQIRIDVVDTGIGIAESQLEPIFRDFYQIANRERDSRKGFGLGLGIVRRLCAGLGWRLEVQSVPQRGTTFTVHVPLASGPPAAARSEADAAGVADAVAADGVLLVDDDALVRDAMRRLLANWNFAVDLCETGAQAVARLREAPATRRHVLLDYRLADEENGLELADRITAEFGDRVRITVMSGDTNDALMEEARRRGIVLLRKPVKPIRLRAILTAS